MITHPANPTPDRGQFCQVSTCPRIQATLGYHNACVWNLGCANEEWTVIAITPPNSRALVIRNPPCIPGVVCPCPRIQATLGHHNACSVRSQGWFLCVCLAIGCFAYACGCFAQHKGYRNQADLGSRPLFSEAVASSPGIPFLSIKRHG